MAIVSCSETSVRHELIDEFLSDLANCAREFSWHIDRNGYLRGTHVEHHGSFCPITALHFHRTREWVRTGLWPLVADGPMGLGVVSLEIAEACDSPRKLELGKRLMEAVGMKK